MRIPFLRRFFFASSWLATLATGCLGSAALAVPTVSLTNPASGFTWGMSERIVVSASAADAGGSIQKVEFYADSLLLAVSGSPAPGTPGTYTALTSPRPNPGTYALTARAYNTAGESTVSAARILHVTAPPPLPVVTTGSADPRSTFAILTGTFTPGAYVIDYRHIFFQVGISTNYGGVTSSIGVVTSYYGSTPVTMTKGITGLEPGTLYHYRMVVRTWAGDALGEDATFTTPLNLPPVAQSAYAKVSGSQPVPIYLKFADTEGDPVTVTAITQPSYGTAVIGGTAEGGMLTYTPGPAFDTGDQFTYTVTDSLGATATATVLLVNARKPKARYVSTVTSSEGEFHALGALGVSISKGRNFTGALTFLGVRYPFRGTFSLEGRATVQIHRNGAAPLELNLLLEAGPNGMVLSGTVEGEDASYDVGATESLTVSADAPEAGYYTMALPTADPAAPLGNGYITGRVSKRGRVAFSGKTGDGQSISFATQLRKGGTAPVAIKAGAAPRDRIYGDLQFPGAGADECTGLLTWIRTPRPSGNYPQGFESSIDVMGSRLVVPGKEDTILDYSTEMVGLDIRFADLEDTELLAGTLSGQDEKKLVFDDLLLKPAVKIRVDRRRGAFTGTLDLPDDAGQPRKFFGVLLQHQNVGLGLLMIGKQTGAVTITPK